jgi:hypothetical protein
MTANSDPEVYLCPVHLVPTDQPGTCVQCGRPLVGCQPGDADDPCRRPIMDTHGRILTRAPLWWLRYSVTELAQRFIEKN